MPQSKLTTKELLGGSEGNLSKLDPDNLTSLTRRQKRPRNEAQDQKDDEPTLKEELLDLLTNWKKEQDAAFKKLTSEIYTLKEQNLKAQETNAQVEKSLQFISSQYEDLKEKLIVMDKERKESKNYIAALEHKIDELQKRAKFSVFEIRNLPQQNTFETQEDLCNIVNKTCSVLGAEIQPSEIKDVYRLKTKTATSTIVTEMTTVVAKNKILKAVKDYNKNNSGSKLSTSTLGISGPKIPIYLSESLTNKDRKLFAMARETRKTLDYKYCWTNNGRIFLKKVDGAMRIEIKSEADLEALKIK